MNLIEVVKKAQQGSYKSRQKYVRELFDRYKEYFFKRFRGFSPYQNKNDTIEFAADLGNELLEKIEKSITNFKLKSFYSKEELDHHLWIYLSTIADSVVDRTLLILHTKGKTGRLRQDAFHVIRKKYYSLVHDAFSELLQNTETSAAGSMSGFELEEFLEKECIRLTDSFFSTKFEKIVANFEKNDRAIFRNYLRAALDNHCIDYRRGENVKKMRRLTLYRDDLPEELFNYLKDLKGYGNLFYYKKRYDCLSIRDTGKALSVIHKLGLPEKALEDIRIIFKKSNKRAEYQRVIDNITAYIKKHCSDSRCRNKLSRKSIKILLYMHDYMMQKLLNQTQKEIDEAKERLKECVICLKIEDAQLVH